MSLRRWHGSVEKNENWFNHCSERECDLRVSEWVSEWLIDWLIAHCIDGLFSMHRLLFSSFSLGQLGPLWLATNLLNCSLSVCHQSMAPCTTPHQYIVNPSSVWSSLTILIQPSRTTASLLGVGRTYNKYFQIDIGFWFSFVLWTFQFLGN